MGRYNLLEESWIPVIIDQNANTRKVSLLEIFKHADQYIALACDTKTQEFAVLRLLLAITQTVFSRFDAEGNAYEFLTVNEKFEQVVGVLEDDANDYKAELMNTWTEIYESGKFPAIIIDYLEKWKERFFLFDDTFPFYQVVKPDILNVPIYNIVRYKILDVPKKLKEEGNVWGRTINRRISESENKRALFSPKNEYANNKDELKYDELARWLITFQGYTGNADKLIFGSEKYDALKGWLFDIGGIYLSGNNFFETLMLNTVLFDEYGFYLNKQKPCWEYTSDKMIAKRLQSQELDNLAELYTIWSRAIYIDPKTNGDEAFSMFAVRLLDIKHTDAFLEPMTIWHFNTDGENKDHYTPKRYPLNQAMWRSFGNIVLPDSIDSQTKKPGIIKWLGEISDKYKHLIIYVSVVGMERDKTSSSTPIDEIFDSLNIHEILLTDEKENGWIYRVTDLIEETKKAVSVDFKGFLSDIRKIRNLESTSFVEQNIEELYFLIDQPFRGWIGSIQPTDSMDDKIIEWRKILKNIIEHKAEEILLQAGNRDYIGIQINNQIFNIASAYSKFKYYLNRTLTI